MRFGKALLAACAACAALPLAACGTAAGHPAGTTRAISAPATASCGPGPARHAWAVELTTAGRMITVVQVAGGLALVGSDEQGPGIPDTLTAVIPGTGRVAWRFDPGAPVTDPGAPATVLSAGLAGLTVATYDPRRLYLLDLRTGRPRWHADTFVTQDTLPLVTGTSVILAEGLDKVTVVDRDAAGGRVRWRDSLPLVPDGQRIVQAGPLALVQGAPAAPGREAPLFAYRRWCQAADLFSACPVGWAG